MRNLMKLTLGVAAATLLASPALAQQRPGQGSLLANKSVQEELKLSEDQVKKAAEVEKTMGDKRRAEMEKLTNEERRGEKGRELGRKFNEETNAELSKVLDARQQARYKQIQFQQNVRRALTGGGRGGRTPRPLHELPAFSEELKLSDEQKEKVKALGEEIGKKAAAARQDAGNDRAKAREATGKLADEGLEQLQKLLKDDQKKKWEELHGKPFTLRVEPRRTDL